MVGIEVLKSELNRSMVVFLWGLGTGRIYQVPTKFAMLIARSKANARVWKGRIPPATPFRIRGPEFEFCIEFVYALRLLFDHGRSFGSAFYLSSASSIAHFLSFLGDNSSGGEDHHSFLSQFGGRGA